jgi:FMN phosphatase YigB (HAD superfamily)
MNDLNIKPSKILHIGDNIESDYNMPRKNGWRAYLYNPPIKQFLKNQRIKRF